MAAASPGASRRRRGSPTGSSWSTPSGFADWVELVYEGGAPLGLSARLFDRPRITIDALPSRLASQDCTANLLEADPALRSAAFVDLSATLQVRDVRDPEVLARIYRTFKIWAQS